MSKYFDSEIPCHCGCGENNVDNELMLRLDAMREDYGEPIVANSICRCRDHNRKVGGSPTSSHISDVLHKCQAADLKFPWEVTQRYKFLKSAMKMFSRIGVGKEFIHVDVDYLKAVPAQWGY